jgi:hypothetical protein
MKTVVEMAEDVGAYVADLPLVDAVLFELDILSGRSAQLEAFAALVRADEREAMVAEAAKKGWGMRNDDPFEDCVREIAELRARGNT